MSLKSFFKKTLQIAEGNKPKRRSRKRRDSKGRWI